jgi:DNA-binding response OmpR family regulator
MIDDKAISVPSSSFDYLVTLMRHSPEPVTFVDLVKESQGYNCTRIEARDITRWQIHKIRKAIEKDSSDPQHLITVRDVGYRLIG